jgi:hypothetical protein
MKTLRRSIGFYIGPYILLACAAGPFEGRAEDNSINWLGDYREALRQARQTQKPIFVEFRCEA